MSRLQGFPAHTLIVDGALFVALITTGLSAGFFYGWQVGAVPGLTTLDDGTYILAMNGINSEIRNAGFALIFFGSPLTLLSALLLLLRSTLRAQVRSTIRLVSRWQATLVAAALLTYLIGLMGVTFGIHVPMNVGLLAVTDSSAVNADALRDAYETRWNDWHRLRTAASVLAFVLLSVAVIAGRSAPARDLQSRDTATPTRSSPRRHRISAHQGFADYSVQSDGRIFDP